MCAAQARKRFGQHFLADTQIIDQMHQRIALRRDDRVLEIGPGRGALTDGLVAAADQVAAIELDRDLISALRAKYGGLALVNADVLRVNLPDIFGHESGWRVVGNLPYNITTPLLERLLANLEYVRDMHFMVQRELAARLAARPGTKAWGRLTVMTQYHCKVERLFDVAPTSFVPPPKVWSSVIRLIPMRSSAQVNNLDNMKMVLRTAFSQRRKRLANALKSVPIDWTEFTHLTDSRPDQLSLEDYVGLANSLPDNGNVGL